MVITRFKYDYTVNDIYLSFLSLFYDYKKPKAIFEYLFPNAISYYYTKNARQAIKIALLSFDLKEGAKIGVQPYTCSSVFAAIKAAGCQPYFIDINENLGIDLKDFKTKVGQIDALIVTHTFGFPSNITEIKEIAGNIPIIEDCSHALLSKYNGQYVGSFFDISVFSFGNGKLPSMGSNGLLVVNNPKYIYYINDAIKNLNEPSIVDEVKNIFVSYIQSVLHSKIILFFFSKLFRRLASNKNINNVTSIDSKLGAYKSVSFLLNYKFDKIIENINIQINNGRELSMNISKNYKFLSTIESGESNYFAFVIYTDKRDELSDYLLKYNIQSGKHFQFASSWAINMGNFEGNCPVFDSLGKKVLTIPCHYGIKKNEIEKIIFYLNLYVTK